MKTVDKIKESYIYHEFGIIPNQIYHFEFKDGTSIDGIIMNFDFNNFCIKATKGMYMVGRNKLDSVYPSKISKAQWEESRLEYLKSFIEYIA